MQRKLQRFIFFTQRKEIHYVLIMLELGMYSLECRKLSFIKYKQIYMCILTTSNYFYQWLKSFGRIKTEHELSEISKREIGEICVIR
jgi:hypothetical protein